MKARDLYVAFQELKKGNEWYECYNTKWEDGN